MNSIRKSKFSNSTMLLVAGGIVALLGVFVGVWIRSSSTSNQPESAETASINQTAKVRDQISEIDHPEISKSQFVKYGDATRAKLEVLDQILRSKNDNDPRLDTDYGNLSDEMKEALRSKYKSLPLEDRNGRGTVAFLLARELKDSKDLIFFGEVLNESRCLSLKDCSKEITSSSEHVMEDGDEELGNDVTLAYPQMVTLQWFERKLEEPGMNSALKKDMFTLLQAARSSPIDKVSTRADEILKMHE